MVTFVVSLLIAEAQGHRIVQASPPQLAAVSLQTFTWPAPASRPSGSSRPVRAINCRSCTPPPCTCCSSRRTRRKIFASVQIGYTQKSPAG
jgi:hypothetical protein